MKIAKRIDVWIIAGLLLLSAVGYAIHHLTTSKSAAVAEVYVGEELVRTVVLTGGEQEVFRVPSREQVELTVHAEGEISFTHSDCPDQVCVHAGRLRRPGQSAACLPNQVIVRIVPLEGDPEDDMLSK